MLPLRKKNLASEKKFWEKLKECSVEARKGGGEIVVLQNTKNRLRFKGRQIPGDCLKSKKKKPID